MNVNIIGVIVDNCNNIFGYRLLDTDENNKIKDVTKEMIVNALRRNAIKIHNIKLVNNGIAGVYYPIMTLPKIYVHNTLNCEHTKILILEVNEHNECKISDCLGNVINIYFNDLYKLHRERVVNIGKNGKPLCRNTSKNGKTLCKINTGKVSSLDDEVKNPNIVWDMDKFKRYMNMHGYVYSITKTQKGTYKLSGVDDRCKYIHLPKEITDIEYIFNYFDNNNYIDTLIIGEDIENFSSIEEHANEHLYESIHKLRTINNIYFQKKKNTDIENNSEINLDGLNRLCVNGYCGLPYGKIIIGAYRNCNINRIIINDSIKQIEDCFKELKLNDTVINTNKLRYIYGSFNGLKNVSRIDICESVEVISESFLDISATTINFNNTINLCGIGKSFQQMHNVRKIDLSSCKSLRTLYTKNFSNCKLLREVTLNENLNYLTLDNFSNTSVEELKLPSTISHVVHLSNVGIKIYLNTKDKRITRELIEGRFGKAVPLVFDKSMNILCNNALYSILQNQSHNAFETVTTLESTATMVCSMLTEFDTAKFPKVSSIPDEWFAESSLKKVIINSNIQTIGKNIFRKCKALETIIISSSVKHIDPKAFPSQTKRNKNSIMVYVVKDSYAHKFLSKLGYVCIPIKEEFIGDNIDMTSKEIQDKYRLILGNNEEYNILLKEPYIHNIDRLFRAITKLKKCNVNESSIDELNTDKFIKMPVNRYSNTYKLWMKTLEILNEENCENFNTESNMINNVPLSIINLITALFDNNACLYNDDFIDHYNNTGNGSVSHFLYYDKNICIVTCEVYDTEFLQVIIGEYIVFQIPFSLSKMYENISRRHNSLFLMDNNDKEISNTITDLMINSDEIGVTLGGTEIPSEYKKLYEQSFSKNYILIGIKEEKIGEKHQSLYLDIKQKKFVETLVKYDKCISIEDEYINTAINRPVNTVVRNIYNMSEIDAIDKEYFSNISNAVLDVYTNNKIKLMSYSNKELDALFNNINNYDCDGNEEICNLADMIYSDNVIDIQCITKEVSEKLFQSKELFESANISLNKAKKLATSSNIHMVNGSDKLILEFSAIINKCHVQVSGLVSNDTKMSCKNVLYISDRSLNATIKTLYVIGEFRANNPLENASCRIDDTKINPDYFEFIETTRLSGYNNHGISIDVAIDKLNGDTYIIGEVWDTDFYRLFRFVSYRDAIEFMRECQNNSSKRRNIKSIMDNLTGVSSTHIDTNSFFEVREAIMCGQCKNFPYIGNNIELFNKLAKQPK